MDGPSVALRPALALQVRVSEDTGSLSPGKCADLIVLDRDIYRIPAHEIGGTRVLMTLLGGHEVHRAEGFDA